MEFCTNLESAAVTVAVTTLGVYLYIFIIGRVLIIKTSIQKVKYHIILYRGEETAGEFHSIITTTILGESQEESPLHTQQTTINRPVKAGNREC